MKRLFWIILGGLGALVGGAVVYLWTPPTDPELMMAKYGGTEARFADSAEGMRIHYRAAGPEDAPVVIFIHGTSASLHTWEEVMAGLSDDYRVIAYDQPGHGLTGPHPERDYTYAGMADGLDAIFAAEGVSDAVLVGNSMGGWVAWRDALENPHRVRALVLVDAAGIPAAVKPESNLGFRLLQSPLGRIAMRRLTPRAAIRQSLVDTVGDPAVVTDEMVDRYWELLRFPGNRQAAGDQFTSPRQDLSDRLGEIEQPTLVVWGAKDRLIPVENAAIFTERMPNAQAVIFDELGHIPMEEDPAQFLAAVEPFLAEVTEDPLAETPPLGDMQP
ncbi:alpha/beta fold hydrolase [Parvularcula lutaonensis]|uniref:Alpha/beta fold hydrolase n=1 Tax=Parvularcula lutaonensis TaxID=491923 RepID=A0ABV7M9N5_9PROT|nr:alpha/beta hydrolase [Parvularcula lutaonensis]GGY46924.1 alpha/beta hydrolase [Parvularcula lutaonensis]